MLNYFIAIVKRKKDPVKNVEKGHLLCQDIFGLGMDQMLIANINVP